MDKIGLLAHGRYQLGNLHLHLQSRELFNNDRRLMLEPKVFDLLLLLINEPDHMVSRDKLIEVVWQGRVVSESAINRAVSQLRKCLTELDPCLEYVETLPKLGYRLLHAPVCIDTRPQGGKKLLPSKWIWGGLMTVFILGVNLFWLMFSPSIELHDQPSVAGSLVQPLTSEDGLEFDLSMSVDGSRMIYHKLDEQGRVQLWLHEDINATPLSHGSVDHLAAKLSPGGQHIIYLQQNEDCQVHLMDLEKSATRPLFQCSSENGIRFVWMPDSSGFYYRYRADKTQPYGVYAYLLDTGARRQLTLPQQAGNSLGDIAMSISNNGDQLAVATYLEQQETLLTLFDTKTMQVHTQQRLSIGVKEMHWDEISEVLFLSSGPYLYQFYKGELSVLFYAGQPIHSFAVAANQIVYGTLEQRSSIWQVGIDNNKQQKIIDSPRLNIMPRLSHDGRHLAFISTRGGKHQIWLRSENQPEYLLADIPELAAFTRLSWTEDDKAILFTHQGAIYSLTVDDGRLNQLLQPQTQAYVVDGGPDGSVIYSSTRSGDWQLWHWHQQSGHKQLTQQGGYSGQISDNFLYYSKFHQPGLWQKDLLKDTETLLIEDFDMTNWLNWQLVDQTILYYRPGLGIYRFHQASQQHELVLAHDQDFIHQYSIRGNQLLLVKTSPAQGDLYRVDREPTY